MMTRMTMIQKISSAILMLLSPLFLQAQFLDGGTVEYEVRTSIQKTLGSSSWAEAMAGRLPKVKVSFFTLDFSGPRSLYKFNRWERKEDLPEMFRKSDEMSVYVKDYRDNRMQVSKDVFGSSFQMNDSLPVIQWKLLNESRVIAGYNCRKAVGRIMDSVYVFAFYTEEITVSSGPCSIGGLPGLILGMTVPRLYTTWLATSVKEGRPNVNVLPAAARVFTRKQALETVVDKTKSWISDPNDPDSRKWLDQLIWNLLL